MAPTLDTRPKYLGVLASIVLLAFALRLIPVFLLPGINYPDEIFQTIEQAHSLVFGYGMVPWEFQLGTRSWILPGALAALIELSRVIGEGPAVYIPFVGAALAMLSAAAAACGALWGRRFLGLTGMVVAGLVPALAMELIYFGPRALSEVVAAHVLVIGLYLAEPGGSQRGWRRVAVGGFLLGLAAMTRIQLAPAIAIAMAWPQGSVWRARLPALIGGAAAAILLSGAIDAFAWGSTPFYSNWRNFAVNLFEGAASSNGDRPWRQYLHFLMDYWGAGGLATVLWLAAIGALRLPRPLIAACVILVSHSLIGHKEYRFIYPAILLLWISCGLGLARMTVWAADALRRERPDARWIGAICLVVSVAFPVFVALAESTRPAYQELWTRGRAVLRGADLVARQTSVCGIGTFGLHWTQTGGYAHFHQRVRYYSTGMDQTAFQKYKAAFNILLYTRRPADSDEFSDIACADGVCVAMREGDCAAMPTRADDLPGPTIAGIE